MYSATHVHVYGIRQIDLEIKFSGNIVFDEIKSHELTLAFWELADQAQFQFGIGLNNKLNSHLQQHQCRQIENQKLQSYLFKDFELEMLVN